MRLNSLHPAEGSRTQRKRVGRGIGSGLGKTAGRGHKGQTSRAGGFHKVGFEGGQMPLQRRLPKRGFRSRAQRFRAEVRLYQIQVVQSEVIDIESLKRERVIAHDVRKVKIINTGTLERTVTVRGLSVTQGARAAIEAAGGKVE